MSFQQTHEIVTRIQQFSQSLIDLYEERCDDTRDPQVRFFLNRAIKQERELSEGLRRYLGAAPGAVMSRWFQTPGLAQLSRALKDARRHPTTHLEEAVEMVVDADKALTGLYRSLAATAINDDLQRLFQGLMEMRLQHDRDWVWQSMRPKMAG